MSAEEIIKKSNKGHKNIWHYIKLLNVLYSIVIFSIQ